MRVPSEASDSQIARLFDAEGPAPAHIHTQVHSAPRTLELKPTAALPRWMRIMESDDGHLHVVMLAPNDPDQRHLAFAIALRARCKLCRSLVDASTYVLIAGAVQFELTPAEADSLQRAFALPETHDLTLEM